MGTEVSSSLPPVPTRGWAYDDFTDDMKAPPERRPAPKGDRDLSLCVVSPRISAQTRIGASRYMIVLAVAVNSYHHNLVGAVMYYH